MTKNTDFFESFECFSKKSDFQKLIDCAINPSEGNLGVLFDIPLLNLREHYVEMQRLVEEIKEFKLKNEKMIIGFESNYDVHNSSRLFNFKKISDYMVLNVKNVLKQFSEVIAVDNPNFPIEYANIVVCAMESGIYDVVTNPDYFMKYRETMSNSFNKKLFEHNAVIASLIISEKANSLNIILEVNTDQNDNNQKYTDRNLAYPHPLFWKQASNIDGLRIIINYNIKKCLVKQRNNMFEIINLIEEMTIKNNDINAILKKNNSDITWPDDDCFSYETYLFGHLVKIFLANEMPLKCFKENIAAQLNVELNRLISQLNEDTKNLSSLTNCSNENEWNCKVENDKILISNFTLFKENCESVIDEAIKYEYKTKEEFLNILMQLMELRYTTDNNKQQQILQCLTNYQQILMKKQKNNGFTSALGIIIGTCILIAVIFYACLCIIR